MSFTMQNVILLSSKIQIFQTLWNLGICLHQLKISFPKSFNSFWSLKFISMQRFPVPDFFNFCWKKGFCFKLLTPDSMHQDLFANFNSLYLYFRYFWQHGVHQFWLDQDIIPFKYYGTPTKKNMFVEVDLLDQHLFSKALSTSESFKISQLLFRLFFTIILM